jgi:hypothetical protein
MNYNIDFAISADITPEIITNMIWKVVEEQTGRKVDKVEFKTSWVSDPIDPMDRYSREVFNGCHVTFKSEPVYPPHDGRGPG